MHVHHDDDADGGDDDEHRHHRPDAVTGILPGENQSDLCIITESLQPRGMCIKYLSINTDLYMHV